MTYTMMHGSTKLKYSCTPSLTSALDMGGWSAPRPVRFTPRKETQYPLYKRLGGSQGRFGHVRKISSQPRFDHRTVQSAASRCTVYTTPVHSSLSKLKKKQTQCSFALLHDNKDTGIFRAGLLRMELELSVQQPVTVHYLYINQ